MDCSAAQRFGVTEAGDAGLHLEWQDKLHTVSFAILITKSLNDRFLDAVAKHADRVIVHATCTGYGGTMVEPKAPRVDWTRTQFDRLATILPVERIVLRVDPIIPSERGFERAESVLRAFETSAVKRVRVSLIDMYPHVAERFAEVALPHPYRGDFGPTEGQRARLEQMLIAWSHRYALETCAESSAFSLGCISGRDARAFGLPAPGADRAGQRAECLCPQGKTELLGRRVPCGHSCLYCYWKDC